MRQLVAVALLLAGCGADGPVAEPPVDSGSTTPDGSTSDSSAVDSQVGDAGGLGDGATDTPAAEVGPAPTVTAIAASQKIGAAGGTIDLAGIVKLEVPAGALAADTEITIAPAPVTLGATLQQASGGYRFSPSGLTFSKPARVTIKLRNVPAGTALYLADDGGPFSALATTTVGTSVSADIPHFSLVGAGYVRASPTLSSSSCAVDGGSPHKLWSASYGGVAPGSQAETPVATKEGFAGVGARAVGGVADLYLNRFAVDGTPITPLDKPVALLGNKVSAIDGGAALALSDGALLTAYLSNEKDGTELYVRRFNADGTSGGAATRISTDVAVESQPRLILGAKGPMVFWSSRNDSTAKSCIRGARLAADGKLARAFDVTDCSAITGGPFAVGAGTGKVAVVSLEPVGGGVKTAMKLRYLDGDGFPLHGALDLIEPKTFQPSTLSLAVRGDVGVLAVSPGSSYPPLEFFRMDLGSGLPEAWVAWGAIAGGASSIVATDTGWAVAYENGASSGGSQTTLALLDDAQTPYVQPTVLGPMSAGASITASPRLASSGGNFAFGWVETFAVASPPRTEGRIAFAACK